MQEKVVQRDDAAGDAVVVDDRQAAVRPGGQLVGGGFRADVLRDADDVVASRWDRGAGVEPASEAAQGDVTISDDPGPPAVTVTIDDDDRADLVLGHEPGDLGDGGRRSAGDVRSRGQGGHVQGRLLPWGQCLWALGVRSAPSLSSRLLPPP